MNISKAMVNVCNDIARERDRQEQLKAAGKFTASCADNISEGAKLKIVAEEFGEVAREVCELDAELHPELTEQQKAQIRANLRKELIQLAAVSVAWLESMEELK